MHIARILVPTDFSDNAKAGIAYGCELARQFHAELHVLNVAASSFGAYSVELDMFCTANMAYDVVEAEKQAARLLDDLPGIVGEGCHVVRSTEVGTPFRGIVGYAQANNIDVIVISTHGYTGLTHLLMGSVAENVVRTAPCPVLTVRPQGHQIFDSDASAEVAAT